MKKFDLIIIGGGAGGVAAAIRADELGVKAALINKGLPLGGTCVNVGCVPSKFLIENAREIQRAKEGRFRDAKIRLEKFNFEGIIQEELNLVQKLREEKYQKVVSGLKNVELINEKAEFVTGNKIKVGNEELESEKFIIATGSTAKAPPVKGLKESGYLTHIEVLKLKKLPETLVILGGGAVGVEMAQVFSRFGSEVFILQKAGTILPFGESEVVNELSKILEQEGVKIFTEVEVKEVFKKGNKKIISFTSRGKEQEITFDEILVAAGKEPNTRSLNLEKAGVELNRKGAIIVNEFLQSSNENVFAVGDVAALPLRLETTAGREGTIAVENIFNSARASIDYNSVPYTVFSDPEFAGVGLTEKNQLEKEGVCACRSVRLEKLPRALINKETKGVAKMIIHPKTKEVKGVHLLAPRASEIISFAAELIRSKRTIDDIINSSLPVFPSFSEIIKLTALSFYKDISKLSCCI
jgi:mercuric reductase